MIVSWNWLKEYVDLDMSVDELTHRLTMSGLNLEGIEDASDDTAVDLEVTSNRPDCLGHIGVAREISVLFDKKLTIPEQSPTTIDEQTTAATSVEIECDDLCPRYIARVIRGVKIGPSPEWLRSRLATLGVAAINNVVDITNYVLLECAQPLHAFDFEKLNGQKIIVRRARSGEKLTAIDQRDYELSPEMCVIADAERPVAIGGVMGGLDTEISGSTVNVLIEVADFARLSIRNTARKLNLHSPSSFRFERGIDAIGMDWASRRCCQLILELAGGELLDQAVFAGTQPETSKQPITLRFDQIARILGIDISPETSARILTELGMQQHGESANGNGQFVPPSWRRDLTREADLIEELARVHGYEKIPDNEAVPMGLSAKSHHDRVVDRVRRVLTGSGFFEAMTMTFVDEKTFGRFQPRGELPPLTVEHSSRTKQNILRQSLIPSLLESRRENERRGNFDACLFEIADVYLANAPGNPAAEPRTIGFVSGQPIVEVKGVAEAIAKSANDGADVSVQPCEIAQFTEGRGAEVRLNGELWGWIGEISRDVSDELDLRDAVTVAELDLGVLESQANLIPQYSEISMFPSISRDLNFVLDECVTWQQIEDTVRNAAGQLVEDISFSGQFRGKQIGADKKSYVVTLEFRAPDRTLTNEEVETAQSNVIAACEEKLRAELRQ